MTAPTHTRRAFVLTALAAAGATVSLLLVRRGAGAPAGGIAVAAGAEAEAAARATAPGAVAGEMELWTRSIGESFMARGDADVGGVTLTAVQPAPARGARPAGIRREPFWAFFSCPSAQAPRGDAIYAISRPIAGLSELFLTRAPDRAGMATLIALFN